MTLITVSDELARQIVGASLPIVFVDASGRRLAQVTAVESDPSLPPGMSAEYWAELQRRVENPGTYSTLKEIKERLGSPDQ